MRQFDFVVVREVVELVPNESEAVLTVAFDVFKQLFKGLFTRLAIIVAGLKEGGQLVDFIFLQKLDIHHIDVGPAVFQLLFAFVKHRIQKFQRPVPKSLLDCLYKSFEA